MQRTVCSLDKTTWPVLPLISACSQEPNWGLRVSQELAVWLLVFAASAPTTLLGNAERIKMKNLKFLQQNIFLKNSAGDSSANLLFEVKKKAPHGTRWKFLGVSVWPKIRRSVKILSFKGRAEGSLRASLMWFTFSPPPLPFSTLSLWFGLTLNLTGGEQNGQSQR